MEIFSSITMLLAFVIIPLLQKELDTFIGTLWNTHRIQQQKDTVLPHGLLTTYAICHLNMAWKKVVGFKSSCFL